MPICLVGGPILIQAALYTGGIVGSLSLVAVTAPSDRFINWGGPLAIGLGVVFVSSVGRLIITIEFWFMFFILISNVFSINTPVAISLWSFFNQIPLPGIRLLKPIGFFEDAPWNTAQLSGHNSCLSFPWSYFPSYCRALFVYHVTMVYYTFILSAKFLCNPCIVIYVGWWLFDRSVVLVVWLLT